MKLKNRVLWWFGGVTFLLLTLFSFAFYYFLNQSINSALQTKSQKIAQYVRLELLPKHQAVLSDATLSGYQVAIYNAHHTLVSKTANYHFEKSREYLDKKESFFIFYEHNDHDFVDILYIDKDKHYVIFVYEKQIDNKIDAFEDTLLVLVPMLLLLLLVLASKMADKILLPIQQLREATQDISLNNMNKTITLPKEDDEIKALVHSFNSMTKRLSDGVERLDRFNSDVSHELKTPLTVIKGEVEITLRKPREPQVYQKSMQVILNQSEQMEQMVTQLLLLTKYTKENIHLSFEPCSLDGILIATIDKFETALQEKNLKLHINKIEPITIEANPVLIESIFINLIDNAIKYTPNHRNIYISLYQKEKVHFIIKDEGLGIDTEQLSKVTDRFYRVDTSRNKKIKGFGLGLSIVSNAVMLHGGDIKINSALEKGTTIDIIL